MAKFRFQENANMAFILFRRRLIDEKTRDGLLDDLDHLCRKVSNFKKTLRIN